MKSILIIGSLLIGGTALGEGKWFLTVTRTDKVSKKEKRVNEGEIEVPIHFREYLAASKYGGPGAFTGLQSKIQVGMTYNQWIRSFLEDNRKANDKGIVFDYCSSVSVSYKAPNKIIGDLICSSLEHGSFDIKLISSYEK